MAAQEPSDPMAPQHVLLVEDNPGDVELVKHYLREAATQLECSSGSGQLTNGSRSGTA